MSVNIGTDPPDPESQLCEDGVMKRFLVLVLIAVGVGCTSGDAEPPTPTTPPTTDEEAEFPDVVDAVAVATDSGYDFTVTVSSPYDSPERYADAWRVIGPDGEVLGTRILTHHHANEQPFTRSLAGVEIPDGVSVVTVEGRDLANGWGGGTVEVTLP